MGSGFTQEFHSWVNFILHIYSVCYKITFPQCATRRTSTPMLDWLLFQSMSMKNSSNQFFLYLAKGTNTAAKRCWNRHSNPQQQLVTTRREVNSKLIFSLSVSAPLWRLNTTLLSSPYHSQMQLYIRLSTWQRKQNRLE